MRVLCIDFDLAISTWASTSPHRTWLTWRLVYLSVCLSLLLSGILFTSLDKPRSFTRQRKAHVLFFSTCSHFEINSLCSAINITDGFTENKERGEISSCSVKRRGKEKNHLDSFAISSFSWDTNRTAVFFFFNYVPNLGRPHLHQSHAFTPNPEPRQTAPKCGNVGSRATFSLGSLSVRVQRLISTDGIFMRKYNSMEK